MVNSIVKKKKHLFDCYLNSGNQISEIKWGDWNGLENTLKVLKLNNNALTHLSQRAFDNLLSLETLDLSGNMISEIHTNAFEDGPLQLKKLNLADNMLKFIPYTHLSSPAMKQVYDCIIIIFLVIGCFFRISFS